MIKFKDCKISKLSIISFTLVLLESTAFNYGQTIKNENSEFNTTCGNVTCDNVKNYPENLITELLIKHYGKQIVFEESLRNLQEKHTEDYSTVHYDMYSNANISSSSLVYTISAFPESSIHIIKKKTCHNQVNITRPKEALDKNQQVHILVNIKGLYELRGKTCLANEFCVDYKTPIGYLYHCRTRVETVAANCVDSYQRKLYKAIIKITAGCHCKTIKYPENHSKMDT